MLSNQRSPVRTAADDDLNSKFQYSRNNGAMKLVVYLMTRNS